MNHLKAEGLIPGFKPVDDPHAGSMTGYRNFAKTPIEEPLSTHADHFNRNQAYGFAAYVKGSVFLNQLEYIIGSEPMDSVMLNYFEEWKFRHPDVDDFIRIAEKSSGLVLDWYKEHWVMSTNKIDYSIDTLYKSTKSKSVIVLSRKDRMMMPLDVVVTLNDGSDIMYNIPLVMMRGEKKDEGKADRYFVAED
jgi:aminopeptidase N